MRHRPVLIAAVCALAASMAITASAGAAVSFQNAPGGGLYPAGATDPEGIALADVNGDGREDAIVGHRIAPGKVSVLLAQPNGALNPAPSSPFSVGAINLTVAVATGDFNSDGKLDVVTASNVGGDGGKVALLLGDGAGGFALAPGSPFALNTDGPSAQGLAAADFNSDGKLDVVAAGDDKIALLTGNGAGSFAAAVTSAVTGANATANSLTIGEFTGDAALDVITGDPIPPFRSNLFRNDGGVLTSVTQPANTGTNPSSGDTNGDGRADVVFTQMGPDDLTSFLLTGGGAFTSVPGSPFDTDLLFASGTDLADLDADGKLDAVVAGANVGVGDVGFMAGNGAGGFASFPGSPIATGNRNLYAAAGDANGDAQPDLVYAAQDLDQVGVLLNQNVAAIGVSGPLAFGSAPVGQTTAGQTATATTTGGGFGRVASATLSGPNAADFVVAPSACLGRPLAIGQACGVSVSFQPKAAGARSATLTLATNAADGNRTVALSGTGTVPPPDKTRPVVSRLKVNPSKFAVGKGKTAVVAGRKSKKKTKRVPQGTKISFTLSEAAKVKLAIQRGLPGRVKGKSCGKPSRKLAKAKKCTRYTTVGTLTRTGKAGANSVAFSGRIGSKAIPRGAGRVSVTATDAAGNTTRKAVTASFKVVKR